MNDLAARIEALRGNLSRRTFAKQLETTESTLRNYEKGASIPDAKFLAHICKKMRITPEWILLGTGPIRATDASPQNDVVEEQPTTGSLPSPISPTECPRCAKLELKLDKVEAQRDDAIEEVRQLHRDKERLLLENAELREKQARLERRQPNHASGGEDAGNLSSLFDEQRNIPSSSRMPPPAK